MRHLKFPWENPPKDTSKYRKLERKDWDRFFMDLAKEIGKQSPCLAKAVGAVLTKGRWILSTGYNGLPRGIPHCKSCVRIDENLKNYSACGVVHAEINCLILCARNGVSSEGATLYVEYFPCVNCISTLINAGIKEIVYEKPAVDDLAMPLALAAGIKVRRLE
jgi:dCMP deaminase